MDYARQAKAKAEAAAKQAGERAAEMGLPTEEAKAMMQSGIEGAKKVAASAVTVANRAAVEASSAAKELAVDQIEAQFDKQMAEARVGLADDERRSRLPRWRGSCSSTRRFSTRSSRPAYSSLTRSTRRT